MLFFARSSFRCVMLLGCLLAGKVALAQNSGMVSVQSAPMQKTSHELAIELVNASGAREAITSHLGDVMEGARDQLAKTYPGVDPAFLDEWGKRMKARTDPDAYLAVIVKVYETHFSATELQQLLEKVEGAKSGTQVALTADLQQKLQAQMTTIQSEIMGGSAQIGAKLGGDIEVELRKEHPEWFANVKTVTPPLAK